MAAAGEVRIHPSAREVTEPLHARAVTIGQDVYFHPGEYRPGTPEGDALLAHEFAHTLQTRDSNAESESLVPPGPNDPIEKNASALAAGEATEALPAPGNAPLRTAFDSETSAQRMRRQVLLQSVGNAIDHLIRMLRTGALLRDTEVAVERNGTRGVIFAHGPGSAADEVFSTYAQRDARIRRIIGTLQQLGTAYRTAPIADDFHPPTREPGPPPTYASSVESRLNGSVTTEIFTGDTAEWTDLQAAYERYLNTHGLITADSENDWFYLNPASAIVPGAARGAPRARPGIQTGAYMVVPDVEHEPLRYWPLRGNSPFPEGALIVELWHDDFGYYYEHGGQRIDTPDPWARTTGR